MKISFPMILQMWENKSGDVADPHPFWTWWSLIYTLSSATLLLNVHIFWSDPFPYRFPSYIVWVCNHYRRAFYYRRLTMGLKIHISCISDPFSSYHVSFSSKMSLTMMDLGPGHMVRALFNFPLGIPLFVSVAQALKWWNAFFYFLMVKFSFIFCDNEMVKCSFPFCGIEMVNCSFPFFDGEMVNCSFPFCDGEMVNSFLMVKWRKLVESQKYFPAQKLS